ncbi:MAG: ABC transporter substrate-binding protein [Deltaproteobacteria bacterium]|nr:ABC transporter substrate-binding protein [Deltaproteobacteria bacterium]
MSKRSVLVFLILVVMGMGMVVYAVLPVQTTTENTKDIKFGGIYKVPVETISKDYNPRNVVWMHDKMVLYLLYEPLIRGASNLSPRPAVCENWSYGKDAKYFDCKIRKGIFFHDGKELGIKDVIFSLNYILSKGGLDIEDYSFIEGIQDYWDGKSDKIKGIYAMPENKIRFEFTRSVPSFVPLLANQRIVVLPENLNHQTEADFFSKPIGSGPFEFSYRTEKVRFVANRDYYLGRPYLDGVDIIPMTSQEAIESFNLGIVNTLINYDNIEHLINNEDALFVPTKTKTTLYIYPNNSLKPFKNKRYRELLYSLVDKGSTIQACHSGNINTDSVIPSDVAGHIKKDLSRIYSIENARKIVRELKEKNETIEPVEILYVGNNIQSCIAKVVNNIFKNEGVPWSMVEIDSHDLIELFYDGKITAYMDGIALKNADAYSILRYFLSNNKENLTRIKDERLDQMIMTSRTIEDLYSKSKIYERINERIIDNAYVIPLCEVNNVLVYDKRVNIYEGSLEDGYYLNLAKVWLE